MFNSSLVIILIKSLLSVYILLVIEWPEYSFKSRDISVILVYFNTVFLVSDRSAILKIDVSTSNDTTKYISDNLIFWILFLVI